MDVFEYTDYRDYIRDYYLARKQLNRRFSLSSMGTHVGQSKMSVKYVIDKKRHLSRESLANYAKFLKLEGRSREYFFRIYDFSKEVSSSEKALLLRELMSFRHKKLNENYLLETDLGYFSKWFYPVIFELSYLHNFKEDPIWIKQHLNFKVSTQEIREALVYLKKYHSFGENHSFAQIKVPDAVRSIVYKNYVLENIELAKKSIEELPIEKRESFNLTISVSDEKFELAKKLVQNFRHELHEILASSEKGERVVQVNMQMFEVAASQDEKDKL